MKKFLDKKQQYFAVILSVVLSVFVVWVGVYGATTISTNINTGGTLTVTGASTLTGNVTMSGTLAVTSSSTVQGAFNTSGANTFDGDTTIRGGLGIGATNATDQTLLLNGISQPTAADGLFYYNTTENSLMMSDGTNWFGIGSTTAGVTRVGYRMQLQDLGNDHFTLGTSTAATSTHTTATHNGLSLLTLNSTSTMTVPLSIVAGGWTDGASAQVSNLFQVLNAGSGELFAIDGNGNASGTQMTLSSTLWTDGGFISSASSSIAGDFTVSGALSASSSLAVRDRAEFVGGYVSQASSTIDGNFTASGIISASTTLLVSNQVQASSTQAGHWNATTLGAGTSTPKGGAEIAAESSGTTTLFLSSSKVATDGESFYGGCIQLKGADGTMYRIYATSTNSADGGATYSGAHPAPLYYEQGTCDDTN